MDSSEQRRQRVLELLTDSGYESVQALSKVLGVSEMTVRRDLDHLEAKGLIRRTHGGAVSEMYSQIELDYRIRQKHNARAKRQIASAAVGMIQDGEVIYLDAGTTVLAMAPLLIGRKALTIVTPSIPLATELAEAPGIETILLGGQMRRDLRAVVGHIAEECLASFRLDKAFLGAAGFDLKRGLTRASAGEIPLKKLAARLAQQVIVLADQTKLNKSGILYFLPPPQVHCLITDGDGRAAIHVFDRDAILRAAAGSDSP